MRIAVNSYHWRNFNMRGWTRYSLNILLHLEKLCDEILIVGGKSIDSQYKDFLPGEKFNWTVSGEMNYPDWLEKFVPATVGDHNCELWFSPINYGVPKNGDFAKVLTLHDAIGFDENFLVRWSKQFWKRDFYVSEYLHKSSIKRADKIITVSQHSKKKIVDSFSIPDADVAVVLEAHDNCFFSSPKEPPYNDLLNENYIFYVGGFEKRKNIPFLLECFEKIPNIKLVLAGSGMTTDIKERIESSLRNEDIHYLGRVDDRSLRSLYQNALCFVYPSKEEGFGLQICEALACGCPTLVADTSSLPEVLGAGGIVFSLSKPETLIDPIRSMSVDKNLRQKLQNQAVNESRRFSWEQAAKETYEIFKSLL